MLAETVTLQTWQLLLGFLVTMAALVGLGLQLINHGRKLRAVNGGARSLASYSGVTKMLGQEKADRQREHDSLKELVAANAKALGGLEKAVGGNARAIAAMAATQAERSAWMTEIKRKATAILNKMGGEQI